LARTGFTRGGFRLGKGSFTFEGDEHAYTDVSHIACSWQKTGARYVRSHVRMQVWLAGEKHPIVVENLLGLGFTADRVALTYMELAERTYSHRLGLYIGALRSQGSIDYGEVTFYRDGKLNRHGHMHDLRSYRIRRENFHWIFSSKSSPNEFGIDGETDPDVLDYVLRAELGLDVV
jgi:hypothetical protein